MTDSTADELGDMLLVIKQRHSELVELQTKVDALLKGTAAELRKLENERQSLAAAVSVAVKSEVGKAQKGLESDLSGFLPRVGGMLEKAKKTALNTVLWAVGGSFVLGLVLSVALVFWVSSMVRDGFNSQNDRLAVIESKLKIKK